MQPLQTISRTRCCLTRPTIGLALTALGTSTVTVLVVIAFSFAPTIARTVRSAVLAEVGLDYVTAAELRRESTTYVLFVEILPNVLPPILVEAIVRLGHAIFTVATLSFFGLRNVIRINCRAACSSVSPQRWRLPRTLRLWCWTNPPQAFLPRSRPRC